MVRMEDKPTKVIITSNFSNVTEIDRQLVKYRNPKAGINGMQTNERIHLEFTSSVLITFKLIAISQLIAWLTTDHRRPTVFRMPQS